MNILISPLNWGIGHASRLTPIIKILTQKHNIHIAADGNSYFFLQKEFQNQTILEAPTLNIKYSRKGFLMPIKMLFNIPKLSFFYFRNRLWLKKYLKKNKIDLIISDNRFGFFSKKIKSIFISHQIHIKVPKYLKFMEKIIFFLNKKNIEKFDELWIPDNQNINIAGDLSSTEKIEIPYQYIGILSRFSSSNSKKKQSGFEIVVLLSGPEPQKKLLKKKILTEFFNTGKEMLIFEGKPKENTQFSVKNISFIPHTNTKNLQKILEKAEIIISRAGYSSIMDLIKIKKTAILIPSPGQTEQEYLANYLHNNSLFYFVEQQNLSFNTIEKFKKKQSEFQSNIELLKPNTNLNNILSKQLNDK